MVQRGQADKVKIAEGCILSTGLYKWFGERILKFKENRDEDLTAMEKRQQWRCDSIWQMWT